MIAWTKLFSRVALDSSKNIHSSNPIGYTGSSCIDYFYYRYTNIKYFFIYGAKRRTFRCLFKAL